MEIVLTVVLMDKLQNL